MKCSDDSTSQFSLMVYGYTLSAAYVYHPVIGSSTGFVQYIVRFSALLNL